MAAALQPATEGTTRRPVRRRPGRKQLHDRQRPHPPRWKYPVGLPPLSGARPVGLPEATSTPFGQDTLQATTLSGSPNSSAAASQVATFNQQLDVSYQLSRQPVSEGRHFRYASTPRPHPPETHPSRLQSPKPLRPWGCSQKSLRLQSTGAAPPPRASQPHSHGCATTQQQARSSQSGCGDGASGGPLQKTKAGEDPAAKLPPG